MYVKIGNFPTTHITSRLLDDVLEKKYGYDWPSKNEYTKYERFLGNLDDIIQKFYDATINKLIENRNRKVKVRIDKWDTWNMDQTLAYIILPMLKQLKVTKHGSPFVDDEDVPDELKSTHAEPKDKEWEPDSNHFKRWNYVLDEMIFAFESHFNDWESQFISGEIDYIFVPIDKNGNEVHEGQASSYIMKRGPKDTFRVDVEGKKTYSDRIRRGYVLFGKYYRSLWD
jgi:hypothetical protein